MDTDKAKIIENYDHKLKELRDYYNLNKETHTYYNPRISYEVSGATTSTAISAGVVVVDERRRATGVSFLLGHLHNDMPSKICSFWEVFIKDCHTSFGLEVNEFYNNQMKEIILIRNCILHNDGVVDDPYVTQTSLNKFEKDEKINLRASDVNEFLEHLEDSYKDIKQKILWTEIHKK